METSRLIFPANQWTGFYMIGTSVMKQLSNAPYIVTSLLHSLSVSCDYDEYYVMWIG